MAEKIISPGVFTKEVDQTFLPAAIGEIGAAIVGPTVKGPALIPTVVSSYSEFQARFGDTFKSGSDYYQYLTSHTAENYLKHAPRLTVVRLLSGAFSGASAFVPTGSGNHYTGSTTDHNFTGSVENSFKLHTLADGAIMNNSRPGTGGYEGNDLTTNNVIVNSGSVHNLRWEILTVNPTKGTFSLAIRRGDDSSKRKQTLETWNNLSLDPKANNFAPKIMGDQVMQIRDTGTADPYLQPSGSYPMKSKYVRIEVLKPTVDYLDENGNLRDNALSASLPGLNSGSFSGGDNGYGGFDALGQFQGAGTTVDECLFYENIGASTQCYAPTTTTDGKGGSAYVDALNLLKNQDEYDINMILVPGLDQQNHSAIISKAIDVCEARGDCFVVVDQLHIIQILLKLPLKLVIMILITWLCIGLGYKFQIIKQELQGGFHHQL